MKVFLQYSSIQNTAILSNQLNCWMMLIFCCLFFCLLFMMSLLLLECVWFFSQLFDINKVWGDKQYNQFTKSHFQYLLHKHAQFMKWRLNNWQTSKHSTFFLGLFTHSYNPNTYSYMAKRFGVWENEQSEFHFKRKWNTNKNQQQQHAHTKKTIQGIMTCTHEDQTKA